ncbi:protein phosphatase 2C domain-containing protein [Dactylosporangium sp. NPDC048998]|uniref:protein phosphatase 2C domain-containing protein n=1 Tax=Dactylosporangium sp. NPDC048998 TaxID=3363976 RepID=UPI003715759D
MARRNQRSWWPFWRSAKRPSPVEFDPLRREPVRRWGAGGAVVRGMLDRSPDSAGRGEPSQDYVAVLYGKNRLSFAVTDGVSSSFLGDLAARFLATRLVPFMHEQQPPLRSEAAFAAAVQRHLVQLAEEYGPQVAGHPIPDGAAGYVRELLEHRREYGSEAMFGCGTIDFRRDRIVTLAWLGDVRLVVLGAGGRRRDFSGSTADRWSSRLGPRGEVECRRWRLGDVERVVLCSDGVAADLDAVIDLGDRALDEVLAAAAQRPDSDDMSLLDIAVARSAMPDPSVTHQAGRSAVHSGHSSRLDRGEPVPVEATAGVPPPGRLRWRGPAGAGYTISWDTVPGAEAYTLELSPTAAFDDPLTYRVTRTEFTAPALDGPVWVRARSHAQGDAGPWGSAAELTTARLPFVVSQHGDRVRLTWPPGDPSVLRLRAGGRTWEVDAGTDGVELPLPPGRCVARLGVRGPDGELDWGAEFAFEVLA